MSIRVSNQTGGFASGLLVAAQDVFLPGLLLGLASESDAALPIIHLHAITTPVETESAIGFTGEKILDGEIADATEQALAIMRGGEPVLVQTAVETEFGLGVGRRKERTLAAPSETDSAGSWPYYKVVGLTPGIETDAAFLLFPNREIPVGIAEETDSAIGFTKRITLSVAQETEVSFSVGSVKLLSATGSIESDSALQISSRKLKSISSATETDTSLSVTTTIIVPLQRAVETDVAVDLTAYVRIRYGPRVCLGRGKSHGTGRAKNKSIWGR